MSAFLERECASCGKVFKFYKAREKTARACSRECSAKLKVKVTNTKCANCAKPIRRKAYSLKQHTHHFCGHKCSGEFKRTFYGGERNPNYKGKNCDSDGYRIYPKSVSDRLGVGTTRIHRATAMLALGLTEIPKGYHVHHRDCDVTNNNVDNLSLLTISDHVWLHKQYGNATLWAFMNGKIPLDEIISWSDDPRRAYRLLLYDVWTQGATGQLHENRVEDSMEYCTSFDFRRVEFVEVTSFN